MTDETLLARIRDLSTPLAPKPTGIEPLLAALQGVKAVLFDVYGTLLISASGDIGHDSSGMEPIALGALLTMAGIEPGAEKTADSLERAASRTGRPHQDWHQDWHQDRQAPPLGIGERLSAAIEAEHEARRAGGTGYPEVDIRSIWAAVLAELGLRPTAQQVQKIALEYECRVNPVWPMPGLANLLSALRQHDLVLGIVSNAQFYTPLILEAFLGQPPAALGLESGCSAWSYQLREAKPATAIYQVALDGLARSHGIRPDQVLFIGNDRRKDIWPAGQLGLKTALFAGDARSLRLHEQDRALAGVAPDRVLTELAQVLQIVI